MGAAFTTANCTFYVPSPSSSHIGRSTFPPLLSSKESTVTHLLSALLHPLQIYSRPSDRNVINVLLRSSSIYSPLHSSFLGKAGYHLILRHTGACQYTKKRWCVMTFNHTVLFSCSPASSATTAPSWVSFPLTSLPWRRPPINTCRRSRSTRWGMFKLGV